MWFLRISVLLVICHSASTRADFFSNLNYFFDSLWEEVFGKIDSCEGSDVYSRADCVSPVGGDCGFIGVWDYKTCVPDADCTGSLWGSCKCHSKYVPTEVEILGKKHTICLRQSTYEKSCGDSPKKSCSPGLSCSNGVCGCPSGPSWYEAQSPNLIFDDYGLYTSYSDSCNCAKNAILTTDACVCQGYVTETQTTCTPYKNSIVDETNSYVCPDNTTVNGTTMSCDCDMVYSQYNANAKACLCPELSLPSTDNSTCVPYTNGFYNESLQMFVCPAETFANTTSQSCDCIMEQAQYNTSTNECQCVGAGFPCDDDESCIPYINGYFNGTSLSFFCPETTTPNSINQTCDCLMTNSQFNVTENICKCCGAGYPNDNNSSCVEYKYGYFNYTSKIFECPEETMANSTSESCDCIMQQAQYNTTAEKCQCVGTGFPCDDNESCIPYKNGYFNSTSLSFDCPGSTTANLLNKTCDCDMTYSQFNNSANICQCFGAGYPNYTSSSCVAYNLGYFNYISNYFECPDETQGNSTSQSCDCIMELAQYNTSTNKCQCVGAGIPCDDKESCIPYKHGYFNSTTLSFDCPEGTAPNSVNETCDCLMTNSKFNRSANSCQCYGAGYADSSKSSCLPYQNAIYNNATHIFYCPEETTPNLVNATCDCQMTYAQYNISGDGCNCYGAGFPNDNKTSCVEYTNAYFNYTSLSFACPPGTVSNTVNATCDCVMTNSQFNTSDNSCNCFGAGFENNNSTSCVPYINAYFDYTSQSFACPAFTSSNSTNASCNCNMTNAKYNTTSGICQCVGTATPKSDNSTCVPYDFAIYDSSKQTFACPNGTISYSSTQTCNCTMSMSTYNISQSACVCNGAALPVNGICKGFTYAVKNGTKYDCPALTQANFIDSACDCIDPFADYKNNTCQCQKITSLNSTTGLCDPYTNSFLNGSAYVCPTGTKANLTTFSCDCTAASTDYDSDKDKCVCVGASYTNPNNTANCIGYKFAKLNGTRIYDCPDSTQANSTDSTCDCIDPFADYKNNTCQCQKITFLNTTTGLCDPYTNSFLNGSAYACPTGTKANVTTFSCDCIAASTDYDSDHDKCVCVGASYTNPNNTANCIGYKFAKLNGTRIYDCPDSTQANSTDSTCDCIDPFADYKSNTCKCQALRFTNTTTGLCVPYINSVVNGGVVSCPTGTSKNDTTFSCNCTADSTEFNSTSGKCVCVGASFTNPTNAARCTGYTFASLNETDIYDCPVGLIQNDGLEQCVVPCENCTICPVATFLSSDTTSTFCKAYAKATYNTDSLTFSCKGVTPTAKQKTNLSC